MCVCARVRTRRYNRVRICCFFFDPPVFRGPVIQMCCELCSSHSLVSPMACLLYPSSFVLFGVRRYAVDLQIMCVCVCAMQSLHVRICLCAASSCAQIRSTYLDVYEFTKGRKCLVPRPCPIMQRRSLCLSLVKVEDGWNKNAAKNGGRKKASLN